MLVSTASHNDLSQTAEILADFAPTREPSVVRSSYGRVRVHLPHWSGTEAELIDASVRRLRGVTAAEANPLTSNVLIFFEPQETSAAALLEALPDLWLDSPMAADEPDTLLALVDDGTHECLPHVGSTDKGPVYLTGTRRVIYQALGWASVGMAIVGVIVPGIPGSPFAILAGYFFVRSSPEAHEWLRNTRWFGPILRDWEEHRGVRRSLRNAALALIGGSMVATVLLDLPVALTITLLACQVVGIAIVLRLRVVDPSLPVEQRPETRFLASAKLRHG
jgi:uncharacterized membrane protein YbaN (DUF454 family)